MRAKPVATEYWLRGFPSICTKSDGPFMRCGYSHLPVCASNAVSAALQTRAEDKVAFRGACGVTEVDYGDPMNVARRPGLA